MGFKKRLGIAIFLKPSGGCRENKPQSTRFVQQAIRWVWVIIKKRLPFIALAIICFISISINVLSAVNYNNAKRSFLFDIYSYLANISKILDNMAYSMSNDDKMINYNLSTLERECIQLDDSIRGLSTLSPHNITSYKFEDFNKMISSVITANYNSPEKVINDITQYREKIQELIRELSPKGELSDNGYDDISLTPNYSLSIKQIINSINDTLASMPQAN